MSPKRHGDTTAGPVAAESARHSACSRSSVSTSPTASATSVIVTGSLRSRRVATSGRSRCSSTNRAIITTSSGGKPMSVARFAASGAPTLLWSPGRPLPTSCSRAAMSSRSGRDTSRTYAAASVTVRTRCQSTVYEWIGWCCGSPRSRFHSGSQAPTSPCRSHASHTAPSASPVPSRARNACRADAGHGVGSVGVKRASHSSVARAIGSSVVAAAAATRRPRLGSGREPTAARASTISPSWETTSRATGERGACTGARQRSTARQASASAYEIARASVEIRRSSASPSLMPSRVATGIRSCAISRSTRRPTPMCSASRVSSSRAWAARTGGR